MWPAQYLEWNSTHGTIERAFAGRNTKMWTRLKMRLQEATLPLESKCFKFVIYNLVRPSYPTRGKASSFAISHAFGSFHFILPSLWLAIKITSVSVLVYKNLIDMHLSFCSVLQVENIFARLKKWVQPLLGSLQWNNFLYNSSIWSTLYSQVA